MVIQKDVRKQTISYVCVLTFFYCFADCVIIAFSFVYHEKLAGKWEVATVISVRITLSYCKVQREAELIYGKYNYSPLTNAIYVFGRLFDSLF